MAFTGDTLTKLWPLLQKLPPNSQFDILFGGGGATFQAPTQKEVRAVQALFPGVLWEGKFNESCRWGEYRATWDGIALSIYAVQEAPRNCRAVRKKVTAWENAPTAFEKREVMREVLTWECEKGETHGLPVLQADGR
jgi:hypothetical protein